MPVFHYKARDTQGAELEGDREAKDQYELAKALRAENLQPVFITDQKNAKRGIFSANIKLNHYTPSFLARISLEEKMNFARNAAVMIGAGLSLSKALDVMTRQTTNEKFKGIIFAMVDTIKRGKTFAEALEEYPNDRKSTRLNSSHSQISY